MKIRAAAYCRVSTDHEDQLNSLENQRRYWEEYIKTHKEMEYIGIYIDEGISGTTTSKREGFNRMMRDAVEKKFDLILTKEVSRFGRNIVDVLQCTRKLKKRNIGVYFESDNINTLDNDGELRLSIMATLAQEESRKISERVKWGHKRTMKNGAVYGADRVLGYDLRDKKLTVNRKEAEIVKKIFQWFLEGESLHGIVRRLEDSGINAGKLGGRLNHSSIRRILTNEKYCGDLIQCKYYTIDYLSHKQKKNRGEKEFIRIQDHHPFIIPRDQWMEVQQIIKERKEKLRKEKIGYTPRIWGGKIFCGECGSKYRMKMMRNKDGIQYPVWKCLLNHNKGKQACTNGSYIREDVLEMLVMKAVEIQMKRGNQGQFIDEVQSILEKSLAEDGSNKHNTYSITRQLDRIRMAKKKLIDLYIDTNVSISKDQLNEKLTELEQREGKLHQSLYDLEHSIISYKDHRERLRRFQDLVHEWISLKEFNEEFVRQFLDHMVVEQKDKRMKIFLYTGEEALNIP